MTKLLAIMTILATLALSGSATEPDRVTDVVVDIPNHPGCGGWCIQVVLMNNDGTENCRAPTTPYLHGAAGTGFSAGDSHGSRFGSDCSPLDGSGNLPFQLHTPVGGSQSDWCTNRVTFWTSNGHVYQMKTSSFYTIEQGNWNNIYYAYKLQKLLA